MFSEGSVLSKRSLLCTLVVNHDLLSLLFYIIQNHQIRSDDTHSGLGPPISNFNFKKMSSRLTHRPAWWEHSLS